jgi:hypothetical protein
MIVFRGSVTCCIGFLFAILRLIDVESKQRILRGIARHLGPGSPLANRLHDPTWAGDAAVSTAGCSARPYVRAVDCPFRAADDSFPQKNRIYCV